jgi:hypothetical protein
MPLVLQCRDLVSTVIQTILDDTEVHIIEHERREKAENAVARALSLENNSLDSKHDAASSNAFGMRSPDQSMQRRDNYVQSETFNREPLIRRNFLEEEFKLQLENLSRELYQVTEEMPGDDFSQEAQAEDRTPFEQLESDPNVEQETRDTNVRNAQKGLEDLMKNLGLK